MNKALQKPKAILLWIIGIISGLAIFIMIGIGSHQDAVFLTAFRLLIPFLLPYFLMLVEKPMIAGFVLVLEGLIFISQGLGWISVDWFPFSLLPVFLPIAVILANFFAILGIYVLIVSWKYSNIVVKSDGREEDSR